MLLLFFVCFNFAMKEMRFFFKCTSHLISSLFFFISYSPPHISFFKLLIWYTKINGCKDKRSIYCCISLLKKINNSRFIIIIIISLECASTENRERSHIFNTFWMKIETSLIKILILPFLHSYNIESDYEVWIEWILRL